MIPFSDPESARIQPLMVFWHLGLTTGIVFLTLGRRRIDFRVVLLGAVLPDLIDKPVGRIFFEDEFQASKLFGHTLLFVVVLMLAVMLALRGATARQWFVLPLAALIHLALDGMWGDPVTLFWPMFGTEFPPVPVENYWLDVLLRPLREPLVGLQELAGLAVLVYLGYAYDLHEPKHVREFLRNGTLTERRPTPGSPNGKKP